MFSLPRHSDRIFYDKIINPINIDGNPICFSDTAEHVGILRSVEGNIPNIYQRLSFHRKALFSVLHSGIAKGHRGNPVAALRLEQIYGVPVLLSGLGSLVLKISEINIIESHQRSILRSLLRIPNKTPTPAVYFLAGSLPASALLHMRQFTLLGMISRSNGSVLHSHALNIYSSSKPSPRSWFTQVANLCVKYQLPHPTQFLQRPLEKNQFKSIVKSRILDFWETKLRGEAVSMSTLEYFKCDFYSLRKPHYIFSTAGSNPHEVQMAQFQAIFLSNTYLSEYRCRHWSFSNPTGYCSAPSCSGLQTRPRGDIHHILALCESLQVTRDRMIEYLYSYKLKHPEISTIIDTYASISSPYFVQFLVDCSCLPLVIQTYQTYGHYILDILFKATRTFLYCMHKARLIILNSFSVSYKK